MSKKGKKEETAENVKATAEEQAQTNYEKEIAELKRKLAKAKGEARSTVPKEKKEIPSEPTSVKISSEVKLDSELGFIHVDITIGNVLMYRSFPKDDGKGIARTIVFMENEEGNVEQKHEYNNIGIANVIAAEAKLLPDPSELDGVIYFALKARREAIKTIQPDQYAEAVAIRSERKEKEKEIREKIKMEKLAQKEAEISNLEAEIARLEKEAKAGK
jgi:hypothetical protein